MINTITVRKINNWRPEVGSLLRTLEKAGFTIISGHNGEEAFLREGLTRAAFIENLIACDEGWLRVSEPDGQLRRLYLVLGNSPGELVCDYSCSDLLDEVTMAHSEAWEGRKQPKCDCPHDLARINKQVNDAAILSEQ